MRDHVIDLRREPGEAAIEAIGAIVEPSRGLAETKQFFGDAHAPSISYRRRALSRAPQHRRCVVVRGEPSETRAAALELFARLDANAVLWVEAPLPTGLPARCVEPRSVATLLGQAFDCVVIDAHEDLDADALAICHGLVWGGGGLILRLPPHGRGPSLAAQAALAAWPHTAAQVGTRFWAHVEAVLARVEPSDRTPLSRPQHLVEGTDEQAAVVQRLSAAWSGAGPTRCALLADRGRGKSSALGLALARLDRDLARRVAISGPSPAAASELFRFAGDELRACFVPFVELVFGDARFDLIIVDEAATLPVPLLRALVERHADAHLCFATTTHGYEGTGRGFSLRFLSWLARDRVALSQLVLSEPIRWSAGDPLERLVFDALLLDAEPAAIDDDCADAPCELERLDRDALLHDPSTLRELFGLLVHAHYRTTPGDLHRLLDAPNLAVHVLRLRGHVVAATLVAEEGELPESLSRELLDGRRRIRAHALPELFVTHLGKLDAGRMKMIRSVRLATHPLLRRRKLATRLVEHVHHSYAPDLFGTVFGATPELIAFRRALGYELVRVSASRGARTGEPSVLMMRPVSTRAHDLMYELRAELARDLPRQLELLAADGETLLDPALLDTLRHELPTPAPLDAAQCHTLVESYAHGPRTFESVALAVRCFVEAHPERVVGLDAASKALIHSRVIAGNSWRQACQAAGLVSVPAAMRALRRALRKIVECGIPHDVTS